MKRLLVLLTGLLCSCTGLYDASFDRAFADAIIRNKTKIIFGSCTPRNATFPLNGNPPIYYAASYGNEDVIDLLYNHGASLQARGANGRTLAYAAAANGHTSTASKLVKLGAGTGSDLSSGAAAYERKKAAEAEARRLQAAALTWLASMVMGGGGGGGGESCASCGSSGPLVDGRCSSCRGAAIQQFDNTYNR